MQVHSAILSNFIKLPFVIKIFVYFWVAVLHKRNEPAHEILILIASVSRQYSDEPAHPWSLTRITAACEYIVWEWMKTQTKN